MDQPPLDHDNSPSADCTSQDDNGHVDKWLTFMGTVLVVAASFLSCLGTNLQKLTHNRAAQQPPKERKPMYCSGLWWLGILCMVIGSVMDLVALPFVPLSRVAALGASGLIANAIVTPAFLGERLTRHDIVGGAVTVAGTTLACVFGAGSEPATTAHCLLRFFAAVPFVAYAGTVVAMLAVLLWLIIGYGRRARAAEQADLLPEGAVFDAHWAHDNADALENKIKQDCLFPFMTGVGPQFYPAVHAAYAGIAGAQSVMFAKSSLTFFRNAVSGDDPGTNVGLLFAFLVPTGLCVWQQIMYMNEALRIYRDALFVLPVYQAMWVCFGVLSGMLFFQEYRTVKSDHVALFGVGLGVCLLGIVILGRRKSHHAHMRPMGLEANASDVEDESAPLATPQSQYQPSQGFLPRASADWSRLSFVLRPFALMTPDDISPPASPRGSFHVGNVFHRSSIFSPPLRAQANTVAGDQVGRRSYRQAPSSAHPPPPPRCASCPTIRQQQDAQPKLHIRIQGNAEKLPNGSPGLRTEGSSDHERSPTSPARRAALLWPVPECSTQEAHQAEPAPPTAADIRVP
eukprot:TRINITY_DN60763_c0_g1_i1.p1 TRINITY_DN60763_c0_g1~~TRINITY_DN60763_c0_g1_i1.p1  ORF type:complete len:571 (+),score=125.44 TRINITY_DN60763_c0_g1_i1:101-1813(+)